MKNENQPPLSVDDLSGINPVTNQWRIIRVSGSFSDAHQFLIKNQYSPNGVFGFHVAQLFTLASANKSSSSQNIWVDRGWVAAGKNAQTGPVIPALPTTLNQVHLRIRAEALIHEVKGSFIATGSSPALLKSMQNFQGVEAAPFYTDLVGSSNSAIQPLSAEQLPDLSTGPHYAYAFQWWFFAFIILVARGVLLREKVKH